MDPPYPPSPDPSYPPSPTPEGVNPRKLKIFECILIVNCVIYGSALLFGLHNVVKFLLLQGKYKMYQLSIFYFLALITLGARF